MPNIMAILGPIFWGLIILSIVVVIHEFGHFLVAQLFHVRVTEFFLGLSCRFNLHHKSRRIGTIFGITPIMLGGYNRITGMSGNVEHPLLASVLVAVTQAGSLTLDELATQLNASVDDVYEACSVLHDWGSLVMQESSKHATNTDSTCILQSQLRDAQLMTPYDRGNHCYQKGSYELAPGATAQGQARPVMLQPNIFLARERGATYAGISAWKRILIIIAGPLINIVTACIFIIGAITVAGIPAVSNDPVIGDVVAGQPAEQAGIVAGSTIQYVDDSPITSFTELAQLINMRASQDDMATVHITWSNPDGSEHAKDVQLSQGKLGIIASRTTYHPTISEALGMSWNLLTTTVRYALQLLSPWSYVETVHQATSVVGISIIANQTAQQGFWPLALLVGGISFSLGVMNLLPFLPLDGGHIIVNLVELIRRKRLSERTKNYYAVAGLVFLLVTMVIALRADILRLL